MCTSGPDLSDQEAVMEWLREREYEARLGETLGAEPAEEPAS